MPEPVRHLSLPETVHQVLRTRILNNELAAGSRLVEANLAVELGVSRSTLREAMRQLEQEGLITISPRRHSVVTRMTPAEVQDACYARYVLEEGAVRAVLAHGIIELIDPLTAIVDRMTGAASDGDLAALVDLDTEFHGCLVQASGKARLAALWATLSAQMGAVMRSSVEDQHLDLAEIPPRHQDLVTALRNADPATVSDALYRHYVRGDH